MKRTLNKNQLLGVFLVLSVMLAVGFFLPLGGSSWTGILIKGVLFITLFIALYSLIFDTRFERQADGPEKEEEADSMPAKPERDDGWSGYGVAFKQYSAALLGVIRSAVAVASSAAFYLRKKDGSLELQAGESPSGILQERHRIRDDDLVERVVRQKGVILESNLPFGIHLAGLSGHEIRSFLGVPLMVRDEVAGVLAVGSDATGSFGEADENFLQRCSQLLVQVMTLCHRGLQWETDKKVFTAHIDLERELSHALHEENALNAFVANAKQLFFFERLTFCSRDGAEGMIRHVYGQIDDMDREKRFPLEAGLVGLVMKRNSPLIIEDLNDSDYIRPRYLTGENPRHGLRSFLGIPLNHGTDEAWGCITIESRKPKLYSGKSREILNSLCGLLETNLDRIDLQEQVKAKQQDKNKTNSQ